MTESRQRTFDTALPFVVYAVTFLVFAPVINWLLAQTITHDQLLHGFLVFLLTISLLILERRIPLSPVLRFGDIALYLLLGSYGVLALAVLTQLTLLVLPALALSLASLLVFIFGRGQRRLVTTCIGAFTLYLGFAVALPYLDWPLRSLAGRCSVYGLQLIGQEAELGITTAGDLPRLLLFNESRPFHVAAECNGFGMLTSCLLMATILVLYQPIPWVQRLARLLGAAVFGIAFNTLRIIIIILLAPLLPSGRYMLMHEAVGIVTTYGGLSLLYLLLTKSAAKMPKSNVAPGKRLNPEV